MNIHPDSGASRPPFPDWVKPNTYCSSCRGRNIMRNPDFYFSSTKGWIKTCSECLRKRKEKRERSLKGDSETSRKAKRGNKSKSRNVLTDDEENYDDIDDELGDGSDRKKRKVESPVPTTSPSTSSGDIVGDYNAPGQQQLPFVPLNNAQNPYLSQYGPTYLPYNHPATMYVPPGYPFGYYSTSTPNPRHYFENKFSPMYRFPFRSSSPAPYYIGPHHHVPVMTIPQTTNGEFSRVLGMRDTEGDSFATGAKEVEEVEPPNTTREHNFKVSSYPAANNNGTDGSYPLVFNPGGATPTIQETTVFRASVHLFNSPNHTTGTEDLSSNRGMVRTLSLKTLPPATEAPTDNNTDKDISLLVDAKSTITGEKFTNSCA